MKKRTKVFVIVLSSVLGIVLIVSAFLYFSGIGGFLILSTHHTAEIDSIKEYRVFNKLGIYSLNPRDDVFNGYSDNDFLYKENLNVVFYERWLRMIMTYDEQSYAEQAARIDENLEFVPGTVSYHNYSPSFQFKDFDFKMCGSNDWDWPHEMIFVGFNESEHKICYIHFTNSDLDDGMDFPEFFGEKEFF